VFLGAIRQVASRDYTQAQIDAWAQVDRAIWETRRFSRPTWVAVVDGTVAGFTDLESDGHLDMMFVHPGYQGIGVASMLLAQAEAAAMAQGLAHIRTEASVTARPFFARRGFRVLAQQQVAIRGQLLTNFRMRKTLAPSS
jgi:putative acetyltransferase